MSQAEASHPHQSGATEALIAFIGKLRLAELPDDVRHYAKRHLLDTVGVMIAGAQGEIAARAEQVLAAVREPGAIPVPGRARRADLLDAAFLGGTAAHGLELDDGYRQGSAHPGCCVVPAVLAIAYDRGAAGKTLLEAVVAGYETAIAIARAGHPDLRQRGFHPTAAVGVFGAAMAVGKLRALAADRLANTLGIAASSAAGLFAFVNGGADIKRLHAGHASREGMQAVLLAEQGVEGPPGVLESRDGFFHAFARADKARAFAMPPPFGITDCYIKPYPCCRHVQPAIEAVVDLLAAEKIATDEVKRVDIETYRVAAEHAHAGWEDFASAQLSFHYLIALALRFRTIKLAHFEDNVRRDPLLTSLTQKIQVTAPPEIDRLYPQQRPARVTVTTARGTFTRQVEEALGSRQVPLDDDGLSAKFHGLVGPVLGEARAGELAKRLWAIEEIENITALVETMAKPAG